MRTPEVLTEEQTLDWIFRLGVARFGDGELRLAAGGSCSSQRADKKLQRELVALLADYHGLMVAIPNFAKTPRRDVWDKYARPPYSRLFQQRTYGSAFITRPDNAPWIDTPEYWNKVRGLWRGENVILVTGDEKSLTRTQLLAEGARSVREIKTARQHAYEHINALDEEIGKTSDVVIMCIGATATALAGRLGARGVRGLDLGHIGMFMRHAGAYVDPATLISKGYRAQNVELHRRPEGFGGDGKKHAERVFEYAQKIGARSICDYGCGEGTLAVALRSLGWKGFIAEYDPAMPGKNHLPKPAQLVACTDVLEHIEPEYLDAVLRHIWAVAELGAFFTIATRPANKVLPDGRNAHLIQETPKWWRAKLLEHGWEILDWFEKTKGDTTREVWAWLRKTKSTGAKP